MATKWCITLCACVKPIVRNRVGIRIYADEDRLFWKERGTYWAFWGLWKGSLHISG